MSPDIEPLRLGFARGIAPSKWERRWRSAVPERPLELVPIDAAFGRPDEHPGPPIEVMLERTAPGRAPAGVGERRAEQGTDDRRADEREAGAPGGAAAAGRAAGRGDASSGPPTRRALRLYTEAIALVVPKDHELVETAGPRGPELDSGELDLVTLLDHPDHAPEWPAAAPWADPAHRPADLAAALRLVATGLGGILMPLPLARHLVSKREHAIVALTGDPLPGTVVWASWAAERDGADVQQLAGVLRGRTARSSRSIDGANAGSGSSPRSQPQRSAAAAGADGSARSAARGQKTSKPKLKPNSRGAQLQAAREKAERKKAEKRQEKRRKRR